MEQQAFYGRTAELSRLRAYVLDDGADGTGPAERPPLLIHGLGGMGKSTLLAKFLLDCLPDDVTAPFPFPFAYVDFARPTLSVHEPATLIGEMARQLGVQYPDHRPAFDALAGLCEETARTQREERGAIDELYGLSSTRSSMGRTAAERFHTTARTRETELVRQVAELVSLAVGAAPPGEQPPAGGAPAPPLVVAVDSFEAAQYRANPAIGRLWAMWSVLQKVYPRLRWIVAGRAPVDHPARVVDPLAIELGELGPDAAVALLRSRGIDDGAVARALAERVGGHPLSLKLAARAAMTVGDGAEALGELVESLPRRRQVLRKVDQMLVQGLLYDRILRHIGNPSVRALAQGGLALRKITPELVRDVLAEPCGLRVDTAEQARTLFGLLARLDLMEPAGPGRIRHRPDLRAIMLRLSDTAGTALMRGVARRAVEFYAARPGAEARAEEIYHRLRLNENPRTVEERWEPGVERHLGGAADDMAPRSAAFLDGRLGGHTAGLPLHDADQEDWERITAREVEDLLAQGYLREAEARLAERRPWTPGSVLDPLLVETLARLGRRAEARAEADRAVDRAEEAGDADAELDLLLLAARLAEEDGDPAAADRALAEAEDLATGLGRDFDAMGALLARSRLAAATDAGPEAVTRLAERLRALPDEAMAQQPALVRAVAAEVSGRDPAALDHTLKVLGLPDADDAALEQLAESIRLAVAGQPRLGEALGRVLADAAGTAPPPPPPAGAGPPRAPAPPAGGGPPGGPVAAGGPALSGAPVEPGEAGGSVAPGGSGPPGGTVPPGTPGGPGRPPDAARAGPPAPAPEPAGEGTAGMLREARRRGTLGELARRLLVLRDDRGDLVSGVAAAMAAAAPGTARPVDPADTGKERLPRGLDRMNDTYLPREDILRLRDTALETGLADPSTRPLLLAGIMPRYRGVLPVLAAPGAQVQSDLEAMNRVERLVDGSVPLEIWLRNAVAQTAEAGPLAVFQSALDRVARDAAGEPDVPEPPSGETKEEIVFRDDTVPFEFLLAGEAAGRAVARLKVTPYEAGAPLGPGGYPHAGTGWLIAPGLLVTNHHVVNARTRTAAGRAPVDPGDLALQARNTRCRFDYGADAAAGATPPDEAAVAELLAWDEDLDYAVLRLADGPPREPLRIAADPLAVTPQEPVPVNIIQHPGGEPKRVALRNNLVYEADAKDVRYFTDTRGGSSGSPVLTDDWTVVALHRGTRRVEDVVYQGKTTAFVNVGTQMSTIMQHLAEHSPAVHREIADAQALIGGRRPAEVV
ncbi:trypsin-like peptidase domain-containing protein [Streptomyces sp. 2P-4]|uniref:trypsin-like peptidase domain-containing protein n=1 Tax=Streptomyces sp. 2P-4 TaxID=2931974 RepID=UPI00254174F4|nr:trypsin-like peptidase domain-containing protein [Streptomyces sp. 2P-4]